MAIPPMPFDDPQRLMELARPLTVESCQALMLTSWQGILWPLVGLIGLLLVFMRILRGPRTKTLNLYAVLTEDAEGRVIKAQCLEHPGMPSRRDAASQARETQARP